jgi:hypothetical protein
MLGRHMSGIIWFILFIFAFLIWRALAQNAQAERRAALSKSEEIRRWRQSLQASGQDGTDAGDSGVEFELVEPETAEPAPPGAAGQAAASAAVFAEQAALRPPVTAPPPAAAFPPQPQPAAARPPVPQPAPAVVHPVLPPAAVAPGPAAAHLGVSGPLSADRAQTLMTNPSLLPSATANTLGQREAGPAFAAVPGQIEPPGSGGFNYKPRLVVSRFGQPDKPAGS